MGIPREDVPEHDHCVEIDDSVVSEHGSVAQLQVDDCWNNKIEGMRCHSCTNFVAKMSTRPTDPDRGTMGRCRKHAPTLNGWPVVFENDWCGDHKLK